MTDYKLKPSVSKWNIFKRLEILEKIIFKFLNPKVGQRVYDMLDDDIKNLFEPIKTEESKDEIPS